MDETPHCRVLVNVCICCELESLSLSLSWVSYVSLLLCCCVALSLCKCVLQNYAHIRSSPLGLSRFILLSSPLFSSLLLSSPLSAPAPPSSPRYFSNPASSTGRDHTTVRRSTDNAQTWPSSVLIEAGGSAGYSCLVQGELKAGTSGEGGLLYEAPGSTIKFARFGLDF